MAKEPLTTFRSYGAALESLQRRFGGIFGFATSAIQVTTTPSQILQFDAERVFVAFINLSGNDVMIAPDPLVSTTRGIRIAGLGGNVIMNEREDTIMPCLDWFAQGTAINLDCYLITVRRERKTNEIGQ